MSKQRDRIADSGDDIRVGEIDCRRSGVTKKVGDDAVEPIGLFEDDVHQTGCASRESLLESITCIAPRTAPSGFLIS